MASDHDAEPRSDGAKSPGFTYPSKRFSDIPAEIEITCLDGEIVQVYLEELLDDPTELCYMLENEGVARSYWMTVALAYAKKNNINNAIEVLTRASHTIPGNNASEKVNLLSCLCWVYLWKCREAPRVAPKGEPGSEAKTKEYYLDLATQTSNDAMRIRPAFIPLTLARGVIYLLRASLISPLQTSGGTATESKKAESLRSALKCFEDAIRTSQGRNVVALQGKARTLYSMGRYADALAIYQDVLRKMPDMVDPDPRIGIGCCLWMLGHKDEAKLAWGRCLEIDPESNIAVMLLALYYLDSSTKLPINSEQWAATYKMAMTEYTQRSYKMNKNQPLTCATFAGYFLSKKSLDYVESLANKALQFTDVNNIASDSWYLLARKEHISGNNEKASDYYRRADEARGGVERGYLPAKFGVAQLSIINNDPGEAKLRLEKMIQQTKCYEALVLLGTLYAEEVFSSRAAKVKEDTTAQATKAVQYLEAARGAWKEAKKNLAPDASVLLNLARLYEPDRPEKALQCLQQVEQLELDELLKTRQPEEGTDDATYRNSLRKELPPQLLNNIGCFYSQAEKQAQASDMFETALSACMRIDESDEEMDTDALLTTISYNLGRSYEARGLMDSAVEAYESLLARHADYTDAQIRLAYIKLRKNPNTKEGPDAVARLYQDNPTNLEVRALYGWFLSRVSSKKRPANVNEDPELRHHKHTLQHYYHHDCYALVGMGNLYLTAAREMRRSTDQEKQKRSAMYSRAVEFFDKALQLDSKNAYAAQGVAIALIEDRKDAKGAAGIFVKIRDTLKDTQVLINLGHIQVELGQFSKAIEYYEAALNKDGKANDTTILACLGRTWLHRARHDRDLDFYNTALEYATKALEISPDQVHFKFNVAFVQIQKFQFISTVKEAQRTLEQLEDISQGLEAAIVALDEIAAHPSPPFPKSDLEQRASMARNTQRKQLARLIESQKDYEDKNKEKLALAMQQRQAELKRREEARLAVLKAEQERQEKIRKEREEILARDRQLAEQRAAEEKARAAEEKARYDASLTTDTETGEKVKRKRKAKANGEAKVNGEGKPKARTRRKVSHGAGTDSDGERQPKKKRRLATKKDTTKYKSAETVIDSDTEDDDARRAEKDTPADSQRSEVAKSTRVDSANVDDHAGMDTDNDAVVDEDEEENNTLRRRARRGRVVDDDESDEEGGSRNGNADVGPSEVAEPLSALTAAAAPQASADLDQTTSPTS